MAVEIERKYLVKSDDWRGLVRKTKNLRQGYLSIPDSDKEAAEIRVRFAPPHAFITMKGQGDITRLEFEYAIPLVDAELMLQHFCSDRILSKLRHEIEYANLTWEIDEYLGLHKGLVLAEVELLEANQEIELPPWIGEEVTRDRKFRNAYLAKVKVPFWDSL
jgi:adenylate cyclase